MTPEKYIELTKQLAGQGLSVLPTRDFDSILLQLARMAQFERMMVEMGEADKSHRVKDCITVTRARQEAPPYIPDYELRRPLAIIDIPAIGLQIHQALHAQLGKAVCINKLRVHAAVAAFVAILCAASPERSRREAKQ